MPKRTVLGPLKYSRKCCNAAQILIVRNLVRTRHESNFLRLIKGEAINYQTARNLLNDTNFGLKTTAEIEHASNSFGMINPIYRIPTLEFCASNRSTRYSIRKF